MRMTRREAIEILQYLQKEANLAIDDWGGMQADRRNFQSMSDAELLRLLNEQDTVEHREVTEIVGESAAS